MTTIENVKHEFELNESEGLLKINIFGYFQPADLQFLANKYYRVIEKIDPAAYELYLDTKDLRVTFFDLEGLLTACFEMIKKDGYKKIIINSGTKDVIVSKVKSMAEKAGLENFEFVQ